MSHPGNIAQVNNHSKSPVDFIFIFIFNNIHEKNVLNILAESNAVFNTKQCKKREHSNAKRTGEYANVSENVAL